MECSMYGNSIYCLKRTLITSTAKLCEGCPIPVVIDRQLQTQIIGPARVQKQLLEPDVFKRLVDTEVMNAVKCMNKMATEASSRDADTTFAGNWTTIYLWNEARIMALNEVLYGRKTPEKTKAETLHEYLAEYGFFELEKVAVLSDDGQWQLVQLLAANKLPYVIAMFDFLGYIKYLAENYFFTRNELYANVSKWFDGDIEGRSVKGNINSLEPRSKEDKGRYTAYKHTQEVQKDYQHIK